MTDDRASLEGELKPCPWCGNALTMRRSVNPYGRCMTPDCFGNRCPTVSLDNLEAVAQWNARNPEPSAREALAKCRDRFREYAEEHQRKADDALDRATRAPWPSENAELMKEGQARDAKAARNREMVELCDAALATSPSAAVLAEREKD